jgi:hypothetical protein
MATQSTAAAPSAPDLTDAAISAIVRSLAPLQALTGAVRALPASPDRVQSTPTADSGAPSEASDRGTLARARVLSQRMGRVPVVERVTLEWLVTYAHTDAHPETLAFLCASDGSGMRSTLDLASDAAAAVKRGRLAIEHEAKMARTRLRHGATLPTDATVATRLREAVEREAAADGRCVSLRTQMVRWGRAKITAACVAWECARNA